MTDILVLSYHALSEDWAADLSVTPAMFEEHLTALLNRGYRGATLKDAFCGAAGNKVVVPTFDDSYRSVNQLAAPILERLGVPGTVFVPTDYAGSSAPMCWAGIDHWIGGPHEAELLPMSWDELRGLRDGGWQIGSHTCSHRWLTTLDDAALDHELCASRDRLAQELGDPCDSLAYPYGDHDDRVVAAARAAGYRAAVTVPAVLAGGDPLRIPRVGLYHGERQISFRMKVSPAVRRLRRSALAPAAVRVMRRGAAALRR